jgi:hypothetical protein
MAGERTKALGGWGCLPEERTQVFCNKGDGVCTGAFSISAAHLSYSSNGDIGKGASFAAKIINGGKIAGVEGGCKYGLSLSGGAGGGAKGGKGPGGPGGPPKGVGGPKGAGEAKGPGETNGSGSGQSSAPPLAAEPPVAEPPVAEPPVAEPPVAEPAPAAAAGGDMADMPGMEGML